MTDSQDQDGLGWAGDLFILPRIYRGYLALHYAATIDQSDTLGDEARLAAVFASYPRDPDVQAAEGFRGFSASAGRWFLNDTPAKVALPPVLTLVFEWDLHLEMRIPKNLLGVT